MTCCYCNRCEPEIKCEVKEFDFRRKDGRFLSRVTTFTSVLISLSWLGVPQLCLCMFLDTYVLLTLACASVQCALIQSELHVRVGEGGVFHF